MKPPKVTVAIPTYNRARYLEESIRSVLCQTFTDFNLVVIDNASSDNTEEIVRSFTDPRVEYVRNACNLGIIGNWNRAIELCRGEYLNILGDDDKMLPDFLARSVGVLDAFPQVGFSFSHCNKVNEQGEFIRLWGYDFPPAGYLRGRDYLILTIKYGCCLTNSSTVLLRRSVFDIVGLFKEVYGSNTFDFNMWLRIANVFDVYFIDEVLVDYRLHADQISELHWRTPSTPTGPLGAILEIIGVIAVLIRDEACSDEDRKFLADRLTQLNTKSAQLMKSFVANL